MHAPCIVDRILEAARDGRGLDAANTATLAEAIISEQRNLTTFERSLSWRQRIRANARHRQLDAIVRAHGMIGGESQWERSQALSRALKRFQAEKLAEWLDAMPEDPDEFEVCLFNSLSVGSFPPKSPQRIHEVVRERDTEPRRSRAA